jgi:sugar phosphate isomerase/epimerase
MKRRIGLAALTVLELSPAEQIAVAAEGGYNFVGLRLIRATEEEQPHPWHEAGFVGEIARRLSDCGLEALDVEIFRLEPSVDIRTFEPLMAAAARLGAKQMLVVCADPDEPRLVESFGRLCDLGAAYGLSGNIEPLPWLDVPNVAKAKRVLDAADRDNSGLLIDALHFDRGQNRLDELEDLPRSRLNYMQLCDAPAQRPAGMDETRRQARSARLFPGEGGLDLHGLLRALPADLPIGLEIPHATPMSAAERSKRALRFTRALLDRV